MHNPAAATAGVKSARKPQHAVRSHSLKTWPLAFDLRQVFTLARPRNNQVLHTSNGAVPAFVPLHHTSQLKTHPFICSSCCLMLSGSHDASTPKLRNRVWQNVVLLGLLCATVRRCTPLATCPPTHGERSRIDITTAGSSSSCRVPGARTSNVETSKLPAKGFHKK